MASTPSDALLAASLDSWDRNSTIAVNRLRAFPHDALERRPTPTSPSIGGVFMQMPVCRLIFVDEAAPESATPVPAGEWRGERNRDRMAQWLSESAQTVRAAVVGRLQSERPMERRYDPPMLLLQHLIWPVGYHHGQIKLAFKLAGQPLADEAIGSVTWDVWMATA